MLDTYGAAIGAYADAGREALAGDAAWLLMAEASEILVAKGKKVLRLRPQAERPFWPRCWAAAAPCARPRCAWGSAFWSAGAKALYREYLAAGQQQ